MPQVRFEGARWAVVMCESVWVRFRNDIPYRAYFRLSSFFKIFCEQGEDDLPRRSFRWLSRSAAGPHGAGQGTFEAHGVVIQGHHAVVQGRDQFFVTEIIEDPADSDPEPPQDRQRSLPLNPPRQGHDHGQDQA